MSPNDDHLPPPELDAPVTAAEFARVDALLSAPAVWAEPAPGLEAQVRAALQERIATPHPGLEPTVVSITHAPSTLTRAARPWRSRAAGALAGVAAASALFVAIGIARRPAAPRLSVRLAATSLVPAATGTAKLTETSSGWRIALDTRGLVRLDNGRFYEAWLQGPKGIVSIGTFHTGAAVTLWAGVEADEYTALTVTIEEEDGDPAQSTERVLTASLQP